MNNQPDLESIIKGWLDELKSVPARDPQAAARGRTRFLAQAVSASEFQRHKGWKSLFGKEQFAMNVLMSILVIAGILFGGGATVNAAQDDLPNQPLYAVKTWSEDLSLQFHNSPEAKAERLLELAQIRIQEMTQLIDSGQTPPDQVRARLKIHLQQVLKLCSQMDDPTLDRTLMQLRDQLQQEDRDMERLQIHASQKAQPMLSQTRTMLQQQLQLVEEGLQNHDMFRNAARNGFHYMQTQTSPTSIPSPTSTPNGQQYGQPTSQAGPTNGTGPGPSIDSGSPSPKMTPMPNNHGDRPNHHDSECHESGCGGSGGEGSGSHGPGGHHP